MKYTAEELKMIIENHGKWLRDEEGGQRANLRYANLSYADLSSVNLSFASLSFANLSYANLSYVNLSFASLRFANLRYANLSYADLSSVNLSYANLSYADLSSVNLRYADLSSVNLSYADLSSVNLSYANLSFANGNLNHLKSIFLDTYPITYTSEVLQIGCQRHEIAKWWDFTDAEIKQMDGTKALEWWGKYRPLIKMAIELSPAAPTGFVRKAEAKTEAA